MRQFNYSRPSLLIALLLSGTVQAQQVDLHGPPGSAFFGMRVNVLPNGNIVVIDASWSPPANPGVRYGAVYLYRPDGTLINTLTGSSANDQVGEGGIVVLANGNYVVMSPDWTGFNDVALSIAPSAGAVTWASATTGVGGGATAVVAPTNSLVGSHRNDYVGNVYALADGNYVVASSNWSTDPNALGIQVLHAGAVTWGNGASGTAGLVVASNSFIGAVSNDAVGDHGVAPLPNGNYVIRSSQWNGLRGAVTLVHGGAATSGVVTADNSLVGTAPGTSGNTGDNVGAAGVTVLETGDYVVAVPNWNASVGAATWCNGYVASPIGDITSVNSLVGDVAGDYVGESVTALVGDKYVVESRLWNGGRGAVTWGHRSVGAIGTIGANPSIIGSAAGDRVGDGVTVLSNGNYVVSSETWNGNRGSVTFGDGANGTNATVGAGNSLSGTNAGDRVGSNVVALRNGNYVVGSPSWNGGRGAVTWCGSATCVASTISAANSLVGSATTDGVGSVLTALSNGNYVSASYSVNSRAGAATWGKGTGGTVGTLAANKSIVGASANDMVGVNGILALANGNYVVFSSSFGSGRGAATWANGAAATALTVSSSNSLVGTTTADGLGSLDSSWVKAFANGKFAFLSGYWGGGGAVTLGNGGYASLTGTANARNSVIGGGTSGSGRDMNFDYDNARDLLVVGRPDENIVSLFRIDEIFRNGFDGR